MYTAPNFDNKRIILLASIFTHRKNYKPYQFCLMRGIYVVRIIAPMAALHLLFSTLSTVIMQRHFEWIYLETVLQCRDYVDCWFWRNSNLTCCVNSNVKILYLLSQLMCVHYTCINTMEKNKLGLVCWDMNLIRNLIIFKINLIFSDFKITLNMLQKKHILL